jgi:hypothetical protein
MTTKTTTMMMKRPRLMSYMDYSLVEIETPWNKPARMALRLWNRFFFWVPACSMIYPYCGMWSGGHARGSILNDHGPNIAETHDIDAPDHHN